LIRYTKLSEMVICNTSSQPTTVKVGQYNRRMTINDSHPSINVDSVMLKPNVDPSQSHNQAIDYAP
jgi:hypothetical protein